MPSLQSLIDQYGSALSLLRSAKSYANAPRHYSPHLIVPQVPYEFSSWEQEQRAWRNAVALFDQTHHMQGIFISGPDALNFLNQLACNKLSTSTPNRAHQIILVNEDGMLVGDGIVFHLAENHLSVYGAPYAPNWIKYQAELSDLRIEVEMDYRSPVYANGYSSQRKDCRYQIQGPLAEQLIEKLNGGPVGDVKLLWPTSRRLRNRAGSLAHCRPCTRAKN